MKTVPIGSVAKFINGRAFKPSEWGTDGLPIIRIQNLTGSSQVSNYFNGTYEQKHLVRKGDILISWSASLGVHVWQNSDALLNQHIFKVVPNERLVDRNYFYFAALLALSKVESQLHGSTMKHITKEPFEALPIALPSPIEQKRLAAILAKADRLRRLRRYGLTVSDTYLQTVFLEMFGDPATNPKGWAVRSLEQHLTFLTSGSRGWAEYYARSGELFLRIQNIGKARLLLDDIAYVQAPDSAESRRTKVQAGDLVLSITADLGRTAVIPDGLPTAYINQHLALLRLKNINPFFVAHYFTTSSGHAQITRLDREGVKSGLNFDDIRGLKIFVPPLHLQQKFAQIVQKHERLRAQQREAARQADGLFQALLHRAFRGELSEAAVV